MELMVDYENITFQVEGDKGDGYQPEKLKPGIRLQRRDRARRNVSSLIIYILLGLCILLSSVALAIALIQMTQTREIKRSDADFRMELSQWKSNVTGIFENAASSLSELQTEISRLRARASISHAFDQWRLFNQRLYYFSTNDETWDEALKFCAAMNSEFVVINSTEEQDYIRRNTNVDNWIGLHDSAVEGTWRWVDGTDYDTNVKPDLPAEIMEGMDVYANTTAFHIKEKNGDDFEPEDLKPEHWPRRADTAQRNLPPKIIYTLLGICILASIPSIALSIILMARMGEIKRSDAEFRMENSQWKSNVTGNVVKTTSSLSDLQAEIALLRERVHSCQEEWTRFKQSCYHFSSSSNTWVEAQRSCASADAHLVVINNAEEQGFLKKHVNVSRWIGLSDSASEGDWRWVDGTDYISCVKFWDVGEPNNKENVEHCGEMLGVGRWNDQDCSDLQRWICEKPAE